VLFLRRVVISSVEITLATHDCQGISAKDTAEAQFISKIADLF
jgi:pterin-4a-carbinolamine dehydratase